MATAWNKPNIYDRHSQERLGIIYTAKTHLTIADRLVLYTLVRGTKPQRILEIGSARGGSAAIMAAAMEDNGFGDIIGLDPAPSIYAKASGYYGRLHLLKKAAPEGIKAAMDLAGGTFDLVFYDGPNVYSEVKKTIDALVPHLTERALIVFDNGLHYGVNQAIREAISIEPRLFECGFMSVNADVQADPYVAYLGLLLVRFENGQMSDPQPWIDKACEDIGKASQRYDRNVLNHDVWWCRVERPCAKCSGVNARERPLVSVPLAAD